MKAEHRGAIGVWNHEIDVGDILPLKMAVGSDTAVSLLTSKLFNSCSETFASLALLPEPF